MHPPDVGDVVPSDNSRDDDVRHSTYYIRNGHSSSSHHSSSSSFFGLGTSVHICPELFLAGIATASAAYFVALYIAITVNANGKRRDLRPEAGVVHNFYDLVHVGMITKSAFFSEGLLLVIV